MSVLIVILLLAAAVVLLCVRIIFKKDGRFSSEHISRSKAMRERGIGCVNSQDREVRRDNKNKINVNNL